MVKNHIIDESYRLDAGKSTLIRLLMDSDSDATTTDGAPAHSAPIIGRRHAKVPTSADVHLYMDPKTLHSQRPILFADCEGFEGGEMAPTANQARRDNTESQPVASGGKDRINRIGRATKRYLQWGSRDAQGHDRRGKRQYAVREMYPRIFHAFSDVIVFVLDNEKSARSPFSCEDRDHANKKF